MVDRLADLDRLGLTPTAVIYGMKLETNEASFEVRATSAAGFLSVGRGTFGLFRCANDSCQRIADLRGGYGTVGEAIVVAVPTDL